MKPFINSQIGIEPLSKIQEFLNEGLKYVDSMTPTMINSGGCGIFAGELSDRLTRLGIKHTIQVLVIDTPDFPYKNLKEYLSGNTDALKYAGEDHIQVEMDGVFYDSKGIDIRGALASKEIIEISRVQLKDLVDHGQWNPTFDRDTVPLIKDRLDFIFGKYESWTPGTFDPEDGADTLLTDKTKMWLYRRLMSDFSDVFAPSTNRSPINLTEAFKNF